MKTEKNTISETVTPIQLTFTESERSSYPVSRLDNGKICLLEKSSQLARKVQAGETWECEITRSDKTMVIVNPVALIFSKAHNEAILKDKISELQKLFSNE